MAIAISAIVVFLCKLKDSFQSFATCILIELLSLKFKYYNLRSKMSCVPGPMILKFDNISFWTWIHISMSFDALLLMET